MKTVVPTHTTQANKGSVKTFTLAEDCGRFFEVGFNAGILTYIHQHEGDFTHAFADLYHEYLSKLSFPDMVRGALKRHRFPAAARKRRIVQQWFAFFLQKGFLAGINFFQEYLQSLRWDPEEAKIEIFYYQCSFCGDNSIYTNNTPESEERQAVLSQLTAHGVDVSTINTQQYDDKGRFLHADTLMLLHHGAQWRILCVDLSVFSVTSAESMKDPEDMRIVLQLLAQELGYLRSKSVFTNLSIDTAHDSPGLVISPGLETYFTAFKREDKESAKLIQAGSYAYDFYAFLKEKHILTDKDPIHFNVVGYTDRGVNALSIGRESLDILKTCAKIYRWDAGDEAIQDARAKVLETIRANAAYSFNNTGDDFTQRIVRVAQEGDGVHWVQPYRECEGGFVNGWDPLPRDRVKSDVLERLGVRVQQELSLLDAHAELVMQALDPRCTTPFLFLTGNPGIGKTTAIVHFLKAHQDEGFLFFYVSPRKQVNLDIVKKFRLNNGAGPLCGNVLALTSNAITIHENRGRPTVSYYSPSMSGDLSKQGVKTAIDFLDAQAEERQRMRKRTHRLESLSDSRIWDRGENAAGVMNSICNALYVSLHEELSNQIVATVAIQSLKKTSDQKDTLAHLEKIFLDVTYAGRKVLPAKMAALAQRIRHVFIMIDEVTGDESGVAFLEGIERFIRRYELTQHGFNTKVIVADASIVDKQVVAQHLTESSYEPNKIYFRHVPQEQAQEALSYEVFQFKGKDAIAINANSYPARRLHLTYKVCVECVKFDEDTFYATHEHLIDEVQQQIASDTLALLSLPDVPQIIVYIQDKRRLAKLIETIRKQVGPFEKNTDYLEIHANISEADKEGIKDHIDRVRVVFMTASASRGLSFPNTTHILVDIPRFEVEQNLMEIIQVIYRSRGEREMDMKEKELLFYLSDRAVYYEGDRELSLRESVLNLLNILLILKTSLMTRIVGYGQVGLQRLMMIPVGGKSVLAAGETYIGKMGRLISELRKEYDRKPDHKALKEASIGLRELFRQADLRVTNTSHPSTAKTTHQRPAATYLALRSSFSSKFEDAVFNGLHKLLEWERMELGYISGGLLIVPMVNKKVQERYLLEVEEKLREAKDGSLWQAMKRICVNKEYPENLQSAVKDALDLIELLNKTSPEKIQQLTQDSQHVDQYYAFPLLAFMHSEMMKRYFNSEKGDLEELPFKPFLTSYIRTLYPVTDVLPIGESYRDFPFVLFRSFNLQEVRHKIFADTQLCISNEMNVLNMLLAYRQ